MFHISSVRRLLDEHKCVPVYFDMQVLGAASPKTTMLQCTPNILSIVDKAFGALTRKCVRLCDLLLPISCIRQRLLESLLGHRRCLRHTTTIPLLDDRQLLRSDVATACCSCRFRSEMTFHDIEQLRIRGTEHI